MLGEQKIVAFSPELGNSNSGSDYFYPNIDLLLGEILPQNLISALYAIQRTGYYLRFFTLKNNYLDCSIIQDYQHTFMDKNDDEKNELKICMEGNLDLYQFSNTIALKNTGFSDFRGKTKMKILINLNNVKFLSIKIDSGSNTNNNINIKRRVFDRNVTDIIQGLDAIIANSAVNKTDNSYMDIDNDNKNLVFKHNNSVYLLSEIEQENIDNANFNLIDIKLYFDKSFIRSYFAEQDKIAEAQQHIKLSSVKVASSEKQSQNENKENKDNKLNHPENETFNTISFDDFLVTAYLENELISISKTKLNGIPFLDKILNNENSYSNNSQTLNSIKNNRIYFANDNYKIKLNQFEIFDMKKNQNKDFSLIEGICDLIIYSTLMFFLILSIVMCFYKIKLCCERMRIKREMEDLPTTARSANFNGKKYAELQALENSTSIRRDSQEATGPKYNF